MQVMWWCPWDKTGCCWFSPSSMVAPCWPPVRLECLDRRRRRWRKGVWRGGWEFGKWSLSSSLYLTHTHMHAHTLRVAVQLTLAQVHCGGVPGGGGVGRSLGGRGGAVIKELWERGPLYSVRCISPPPPHLPPIIPTGINKLGFSACKLVWGAPVMG